MKVVLAVVALTLLVGVSVAVAVGTAPSPKPVTVVVIAQCSLPIEALVSMSDGTVVPMSIEDPELLPALKGVDSDHKGVLNVIPVCGCPKPDKTT